MLRFSSKEKDRDRERDKEKRREREKDRDRHHKSSSAVAAGRPPKKSSTGASSGRKTSSPVNATTDRLGKENRMASRSTSDLEDSKRSQPGLSRLRDDEHDQNSSTTSLTGPRRSSVPYPTFSKAHSKESVAKEPQTAAARTPKQVDVFTPDPTDLGSGKSAWHDGDIGRKEEEDLDVTQRANGAELGNKSDQPDSRTSGAVPPSPPLTAVSQPAAPEGPKAKRRIKKESSKTGKSSPLGEHVNGSRTSSGKHRSRTSKRPVLDGKNRRSSKEGSPISPKERTASPAPTSPHAALAEETTVQATPLSAPPPLPFVPAGESNLEGDGSAIDSEATSRARGPQPNFADLEPPTFTPGGRDAVASPINRQAPTPWRSSRNILFPHAPNDQHEVGKPPSTIGFDTQAQNSAFGIGSPQPPPPPPPPPMMPMVVPRVDYLLYNGGLPRNVPKTLLGGQPAAVSNSQTYQQTYGSPRTPAVPSLGEVERIFAPYHSLLDQYETVLSKNGSMAVATGYRSVARRLLDRLEAVFARDISSERCTCVMCQNRTPAEVADERSLGWGDILEWVSGRREIPAWPAFDFSRLGDPRWQTSERAGGGLGILHGQQDLDPPVDIDVPEEFREHYIRQSKKTKAAVDNWLSSQPANPSSPPQEVDDETLTFAILTHLEQHERPIFTALLTSSPISPSSPPSRAPTPLASRPRPELLNKTGTALQRLYRLAKTPRSPESAIFLLRHPELHPLLSTLAAVTAPEWEVLTSGRFDGFLWSGAEEHAEKSQQSSPGVAGPNGVSRGPTPLNRGPSIGPGPGPQSRTTTPFSMPGTNNVSRSATPFSMGGTFSPVSRGTTPGPPVGHDEETEIAILAEVEREIYLGMEALEDAFEGLHRKAEGVRRALRERGAGLSMVGQSRRSLSSGGVEVVTGTPAMGSSAWGAAGGWGAGWESEDELTRSGSRATNGIGDDCGSEVWPDDSASNISSSRVRRPKRRNERRTPAPVEEEDEGGVSTEDGEDLDREERTRRY
ncbi:MAG: hypothetical protein M4579_004448 [Chaenotheca gracillima]|nr:MAG: hypothetical protein M4579_004448 [Chaenotheca gracillima]